jgi:ABC-type antimicrobial peptide transport system permease subunit
VAHWAGHPPAFSHAIITANNASATIALTKTLSQKGFVVFSLREITKGIDTFVIIIQSVLGAFGGIALVVAGIMIALVMMWAVLERTREIGILKALGARAQDIRRVFVDEAALIGLLAGIIGLAGAYLTAILLQAVLKMLIERAGGTAPVSLFVVPWWLVVSALAFGMVVGTVGSWIPAFRASRLSVVQALRHDG